MNKLPNIDLASYSINTKQQPSHTHTHTHTHTQYTHTHTPLSDLFDPVSCRHTNIVSQHMIGAHWGSLHDGVLLWTLLSGLMETPLTSGDTATQLERRRGGHTGKINFNGWKLVDKVVQYISLQPYMLWQNILHLCASLVMTIFRKKLLWFAD